MSGNINIWAFQMHLSIDWKGYFFFKRSYLFFVSSSGIFPPDYLLLEKVSAAEYKDIHDSALQLIYYDTSTGGNKEWLLYLLEGIVHKN